MSQDKPNTVVACIDSSDYAKAACDAAIWSAQHLAADLQFLNVVSRRKQASVTNYSGQIGLGTREHLLQELASLDDKRARVMRDYGADLLTAAVKRAQDAGLTSVDMLQRHGELVDALTHVRDNTRLVVLGKRGAASSAESDHLGSNLERVIRSHDRPILITNTDFIAPTQAMLAFDGSANAARLVELLSTSSLLTGCQLHLVYVGEPNITRKNQINDASKLLEKAGLQVTIACLQGHVEPALDAYQQHHGIDLVMMGAYGHSRIRQLLLGSTTTDMIRRCQVSLLITR